MSHNPKEKSCDRCHTRLTILHYGLEPNKTQEVSPLHKSHYHCLHVGHRHLADDALDLTHLDLCDVGAYVLAVRRALR